MKFSAEQKKSLLHWCLAMILCPLGVCLSVKSGFGVSMIEAPVYVLYRFLSERLPWYTMGTSEYVVQGILLVALCIVIRKFKWQYLLSFVAAMIFGFIVDGWYLVFGQGIYGDLIVRIISGILGMTITSFAVALFFRTAMPLEVWELFVKEFADNFHIPTTKVKWVYDVSSLSVGILLMLILFRAFDGSAIGIGTLVTTLLNAPLIGAFGKLIDHIERKE